MSIDEGAALAELVALAGEPTRQEAPRPECMKKSGVKEVVYERKIVRLRGWFGTDLSSAVMFCVDGAGKLVAKNHYQY